MPSSRGIRCLQEDNSGSSSSRLQDLGHMRSVELEKRFQELTAVLQKARDAFSCRLEEEQANPLKELRTRLIKAKERFHSRLANSSRFPDPGGFYPVEHENPFSELRSVLRSARVNFVPLLDQYILDNSSNSSSSDSYDQSLEQKSNSIPPVPRPTNSLEENRRPPQSPNENNFAVESPSRLHWLLEEETRSRRKSKSSKPPAAAPKHQPQEGMKNAPAPALAPAPASVSPGQRLDLLINEELDRKRASGTAFQRLPLRTGKGPP